MEPVQLNPDQRALVERHIGLVGVHLRRYVRTPAEPTRRCEREDLYQEGCLALTRAAAEYDAERHGAFQGFALNRIHSAVSQAIYEKFASVHVPYQVARGHRPDPRTSGSPHDRRTRTPVGDGVIDGVDLALVACRATRSDDAETLGDRVRDLIVAHGRAVAAEMIAGFRGREDRERMIRAVLAERVLIPEPEQKRPLRQLAKALGCSVSRIVACEQRLLGLLRARLEHDRVYACLCALAAARPESFDAALSERDAAEIATAELEQFEHTYAQSPPADRGDVLVRLADRVSGGADRLATLLYARLPADERRDRRFCLFPKGGPEGRGRKAS